MNYKKVYNFMVEEEVENGETVYCLDRNIRQVVKVNELSFAGALRLINDAHNDDNNRYEFWKEINEDA